MFWCRRHASDDGMDTFRHIDVLLIMNSRIGKLKISWTVVDCQRRRTPPSYENGLDTMRLR